MNYWQHLAHACTAKGKNRKERLGNENSLPSLRLLLEDAVENIKLGRTRRAPLRSSFICTSFAISLPFHHAMRLCATTCTRPKILFFFFSKKGTRRPESRNYLGLFSSVKIARNTRRTSPKCPNFHPLFTSLTNTHTLG